MAEYISDSEYFLTVNASDDTLIAGICPDKAILHYDPLMIVNKWYRYYNVSGFPSDVTETDDTLTILASATTGTQNGIIQKLSNLTIGETYEIEINLAVTFEGIVQLFIFDGLTQKSSQTLTPLYDELITFTATSTENTLVLQADSTFAEPDGQVNVNYIRITTPQREIPYMAGFVVKPDSISSLGEVFFTDGTYTDIRPNQSACEAYGYEYNPATATCTAFKYNFSIDSITGNIGNKNNGPGNSNELGSNTIQVNGTHNTTRGFNNNCLINGNNNEIANAVNDSTVLGTLGEATATNSLVLGGNASGDILGERQGIQLLYGRQTTNNSTVSSYLNNTTGEFFTVPDNSIIYFHAETIAVRVGGSAGAGAVGDYGTWVERGVVINKSGVLSIQRERDTIKTSGTITNWRILASTSGTDFLLTVRGQTDMTLEWCCNVNITQIKTGVTL